MRSGRSRARRTASGRVGRELLLAPQALGWIVGVERAGVGFGPGVEIAGQLRRQSHFFRRNVAVQLLVQRPERMAAIVGHDLDALRLGGIAPGIVPVGKAVCEQRRGLGRRRPVERPHHIHDMGDEGGGRNRRQGAELGHAHQFPARTRPDHERGRREIDDERVGRLAPAARIGRIGEVEIARTQHRQIEGLAEARRPEKPDRKIEQEDERKTACQHQCCRRQQPPVPSGFVKARLGGANGGDGAIHEMRRQRRARRNIAGERIESADDA
jgi:hypothetical protein